MAGRPTNFIKADIKRIIKGAKEADPTCRVVFTPDGQAVVDFPDVAEVDDPGATPCSSANHIQPSEEEIVI